VLDAISSPGIPLAASSRSFFEHRFGHDFSRVRIHDDAAAERSAAEIGALAYTVGKDIVFGAGHFAPQFQAGRQLLAHELAHVIQQGEANPTGGGPDSPGILTFAGAAAASHRVQREAFRLTASTDLSGIQSRLEEIIRSGGPLPDDQTRVIAAAIVDIPGYKGPIEIRAISGAATDALGQGAPVHHATSPRAETRTLSATRSIGGSGTRREFPFSHINDAEIKIFEEITRNAPKDAKGTVHFTTMRNRVDRRTHESVLEPVAACSGCNRATFEMAGLRGIDMVTYAAVHSAASHDLANDAHPPIGEPRIPGDTSGTPEKTPERTTNQAVVGESASQGGVPLEMPLHPIGQSAHAALEFGALALLSAQLDAVRGAELAKAEAALRALTPQIEQFRQQGKSVTVTLVVEVPDQIDIAAVWAGIGDPDQVVYFRKMFISSAVKATSQTGPANASMRPNEAPGDPDRYDPQELSLNQQIEGQMGEKYPIASLRPRKGFHFASRDLGLPAYTVSEQPGGRGILGAYRPIYIRRIDEGEKSSILTYGMKRVLRISGDAVSLNVTMVDMNDARLYDAGSIMRFQQQTASFDQTFEKDTGSKSDGYRIRSHFRYVRTQDFDLLIEDARGTDLDPHWGVVGSRTWRARLVWLKQ
jgi:hypothetical protein